MHDIRESRCLDAFAGSGALGLEAFSRGAAQVIFLEQSVQAHAHLKKIVTAFDSPKIKIIHTDALDYLHHSQESFDLIFLDPPFVHNWLPQCILSITQSQVLKPGGLIYLESASEIQLDETQWRQIKLKKAGQVNYGLFEKLW